MNTWLIVLCVVLAVALAGVCLAAFDMIVQLCEDLDDAQAERDAALIVCDEQAADLATLRRESIRSVKTTPAAANVINIIARNEAARDLANERIQAFMDDWSIDPDEAS